MLLSIFGLSPVYLLLTGALRPDSQLPSSLSYQPQFILIKADFMLSQLVWRISEQWILSVSILYILVSVIITILFGMNIALLKNIWRKRKCRIQGAVNVIGISVGFLSVFSCCTPTMFTTLATLSLSVGLNISFLRLLPYSYFIPSLSILLLLVNLVWLAIKGSSLDTAS